MKISELIAELQAFLEKHGDLTVFRPPGEGERGRDVEVDDVYVEFNETGQFLEVYLS